MSEEFTHFDSDGNAFMVDVSGKDVTKRMAIAQGTIRVSKEVMDAILGKKVKKGDVLTVAQVAGIMGTKRTSELIDVSYFKSHKRKGYLHDRPGGGYDHSVLHGED